MNWTTPADIQAAVLRQWERGRILIQSAELFPLRIPLKGPTSQQLAERFGEVQEWIRALRAGEGLYRLEFRSVRHRLIGANLVPFRVFVDTPAQALTLLDKQAEAALYQQLCEAARQRCPELLAWLTRKPLRALELADEWSRMLDVVSWVQAHPDSGLYIRQVDFPGVHTKFIEQHKSVLTELLDLVLPGEGGFERRFGFREKSARVRFRLLDASAQLPEGLTDLSLVSEEFARFVPALQRVFITENEINFLCFPNLPNSLVIFGSGYSIENLSQALWLRDRSIYYWGDIDTHGFAILDQLRRHFPQVQSLLMDRSTLLAHRSHWVCEKKPTHRDLPHLTPEERDLYEDLCNQRLGIGVRLEQEMIGFPWVHERLRQLPIGWPADGVELFHAEWGGDR